MLPRFILAALLTLGGTASASQVVFSEVMYHPLAGKPEFIEVENLSATPLDMARWQFTEGVTFVLPDFSAGASQSHFLKGFERILFSSADDPTTRATYPGIPAGVRIFGPWAGSLDHGGERLTLQDKNGVVAATLKYGDSGHWPVQADGAGHSLVLADNLRAIDDWRGWRASTARNGSPGLADPAPAAAGLALNELHFTAAAHVDWVELRNNAGTATVAAGGLFVASLEDFSDKVALAGSVAPGAVLSVGTDFAADGNGDVRLFLIDATNNVRGAVKIRRRPGRESWQNFPAGSTEWYSAVTDTRDTQNNPARNTDIVLNEIMANPPSGQRDGEFIELYNRGAAAVNVGGWQLADAVNFTIPPGTTIAPGGYLVLAANAAWLNANYAGLAALGDWGGALRNGGDLVRLTDADGNLANQVDYLFGGEWPEQAGGNGSSLELVNPSADNTLGGAWADSDESAKGAWQSFTINGGNFKNVTYGGPDTEVRLWLPGDGHLVLRNLVLRPTAGGGNLFVNGTVTTLANDNISGWQSRGTHWGGYHDAEGVHLVADGSGDAKVNHMEKDAAGMTALTDYTMTFDARWVSGLPRLVAQTWDMSWGGTVLVPVPLNLGTPGAANTRLAAGAPPQVTSGLHSPAVPTASQTVTVTARVSSPGSALASVVVKHRLDNINANAAWNTTTMLDNGTGGDVVANDGIYTAQIVPASFAGYNVNGAIIEFYALATAANGLTGQFPRGGAATPGLWVADSQAPSTDLRRMRTVISAYWVDALNNSSVTGGQTVKFNYKFPRFSDHYFPCTYIHNDGTVYYGCSVRKTGSPFTRQTDGNLTRGVVALPGDRPLRGHGKLYWDNDGAGGSMLHNRIHRYWLYLLGVPGNENEVCRVTRNSDTYAVRETSETFDKDLLNRIWPNGSDGQFYEIDDKFTIADDGTTRLSNTDGSWDYDPANSPGAENPTSYHNNFHPKSRELEYDYSAFTEWCRQIEQNGAALTQEQYERMADTQAMAAYAAVRGYTADWDNITMGRGKNGFFYNRSTDHKWMLLHWDSDNALQSGRINDAVIGTKTNVPTYYARPFVRRYLNYYLTQMIGAYAANGPRLTAWLTAEENASASYTVPATYATWPTTNATSGTVQTRHAVIQTFIGASLGAPFALTSPPATTTGSTVDINGTAPTTAFRVVCAGHPEAVLAWTGTSIADVAPWRLSGILLASGGNALTFRLFDAAGAQVGADLTYSITKTGNAPPVVALNAAPAAQNVALGELLSLEAGASYDPESAGPLSYSWTATPASGFTMTAPAASTRGLTFSTPGTYTVTVQVTDAALQTVSRSVAVSVYNSADFDSFGDDYLTGYTLQGLRLRDNYSPDAWYSLNETSGSLVVQVTDSAARPLTNTAPTYPKLTRALPVSSDFLLQTGLSLETRQFGSFITGLLIETTESGVLTRYAFGLSGGTALVVQRASGAAGAFAQVSSAAYSGGDLTLRVQRAGTALNFQRRVNGTWTNLFTQTLAAGTTAGQGGLFLATTAAQQVRAAFDYLLLGDPGNSSDLINSLRITEIMYNPAGVGGVEFIELQNIGAAAINLSGAYFEDGNPFSTQFTFGSLTLQPGQYCVVTNDSAGFQALYGTGLTIAGQSAGSLNNDGERIVLRDSAGNVILDFTYDDIAPWPVSADGGGKSLEVLTFASTLYGNGASWRASQETGGSPGYLGLAYDSDGDGFPDVMELAYGTNPASAASQPLAPATARDAGTGTVTLTWASQNGRTYTVQYRDDLASGTWQPLATVTATGTAATYPDTAAAGQPARFYRLSTQFP